MKLYINDEYEENIYNKTEINKYIRIMKKYKEIEELSVLKPLFVITKISELTVESRRKSQSTIANHQVSQ